ATGRRRASRPGGAASGAAGGQRPPNVALHRTSALAAPPAAAHYWSSRRRAQALYGTRVTLDGHIASMLRNVSRSRRVWLWIGAAGVSTLWMGIASHRRHDRYRRALARFDDRPSTYAVEMGAVVSSVLSRAPIGSPRTRVVALH